mmetsp:Transcript_15555/g.39374  ORF Transcript_15555/g.39374 Transcript_15555/m.39374 type:complete len:524 (-) Transcript_15555:346-1917(-)
MLRVTLITRVAAVPAEVVLLAVAIVLAICNVLLRVVRHEVAKRESVVARDEIHGCPRPTSRIPVKARETAERVGERARLAVGTLDEVAHRVSELSVPLKPPAALASGEVANLVQATAVPRLGDQLRSPPEHGILVDGVNQRRQFERRAHRHVGVSRAARGGRRAVPRRSRQRRREIEAESVNVVLGHPVAQAVEDKLPAHGVVGSHRISAPAVVVVVTTLSVVRNLVVANHVVRLVVEAAEAQDRPVLVTLRGVVEHDVQNHLDALGVQRLDHVLELVAHVRGVARVARHGCEEADGGVSPEVASNDRRLVAVVLELVKLVHRQQLDGVDAKPLEVRRAFRECRVRASLGSHAARGMAREPAHVALVHDEVADVDARRRVTFPVERHFVDVGNGRRASGPAVPVCGNDAVLVRIRSEISPHNLRRSGVHHDALGIASCTTRVQEISGGHGCSGGRVGGRLRRGWCRRGCDRIRNGQVRRCCGGGKDILLRGPDDTPRVQQPRREIVESHVPHGSCAVRRGIEF